MQVTDPASVRVFRNEGGRPKPLDVLHALARDGINRVLIEAGPGLAGAFLKAGLVDEIWSFRGPRIIGDDGLSGFPALGVDRIEEANHFHLIAIRRLGDDTLAQYGRVQPSEFVTCSPES